MYFEDYSGPPFCYVSIVLLMYNMTYIHTILASGYDISFFHMDLPCMPHGHVLEFHVLDLECKFRRHVQFLFMTEHGYSQLKDIIKNVGTLSFYFVHFSFLVLIPSSHFEL